MSSKMSGVPRAAVHPGGQPGPTGPGFGVTDAAYVVFRHKWKILLITLAGLVAAASLRFVSLASYQSEAKLLIRYVTEVKSPGQLAGADARTKSPDQGGQSVINTELQLLTSLDLAHQVAQVLGPGRILARAGGGTNLELAAAAIRKGLTVEVPSRSSVIRLVFLHPDPTLVQPVMVQLIQSYLQRHAEIHRALGMYDEFLTKETDELRSRLRTTDEALRKAKAEAGVFSVEDGKRMIGERLSKLSQDVFATEAELAERQAVAIELRRMQPGPAVASTNLTEASPATPAGLPGSSPANTPSVPAAVLAEHRRLESLIEILNRRAQEHLLRYKPENSLVQSVREQIAFAEKSKGDLEVEHPGLAARASAPAGGAVPAATSERPTGLSASSLELMRLEHVSEVARSNALAAELTRTAALQSKLKVLASQLEATQRRAAALDDHEGAILELQRRKDMDEARYRSLAASQEQARMDEALGAGRVSNIGIIQAASPPVLAVSKLNKMMAMLVLGSLATALGLAFAIELGLDTSLKRPIEVESRLGLPLFLSIPSMPDGGMKGFSIPKLVGAENAPEKASMEEGVVQGASLQGLGSKRGSPDAAAVWRPFFEALRDRILVTFEIQNLVRKPKLVAVTSCGEGAGVTTVATGLAAALSETGDGNVLLIDMNIEHGAAHRFYQGSLDQGIEDVLGKDTREGALVQENLYVVAEGNNGERLSRVTPRRFRHLVPKFEASDYDYIIFDMPPVHQLSVTPGLARFMDMVLLVVEAERTDRDVVKRAAARLGDSSVNLAVVFNKTRSPIPKRLQRALEPAA